MNISKVKKLARAHGLLIWGKGSLTEKAKVNPSSLVQRKTKTGMTLDTALRLAVVIADHAKVSRRDVLAELSGIDSYKVKAKPPQRGRESWGS